jgi:septal ring factor EnvC (AmiA/AmiB activator)
VPKWAEKLDAHLRAGGLGHIADTAQVSMASPGTGSTPPPDGDLEKLLETVADKAAARAVQAIRPMIEKYTATVEKALAEQRDELRGLSTQMRDQEARLRHLEEEFRVLHAEVEKSKIADAESKTRAPSIMEQPASTPEPLSAVSAEPAVPVVEAEVVEDVSASDPGKQGADDGLHAAAELEKLAGVTGLRSALGDVQQGIGDLKAQVASNDSLIKEMEAMLAQARRQKEEAGAAH